MESSHHETSYTLLQRAIDLEDKEAWEYLVEHYRRFIYFVLHGLNVAQSDVDDICQQVLISLARDLQRYDRSVSKFRTWLSTMIRNVAVDHFRKQASQKRRIEGLRESAIFEDNSKITDIDHYIEKEWANYIVSQAMERVGKQFKGKAMDVFNLCLEGLDSSTIAERTGLTISSVYTLRKRVKRALYLEVQELTQDLESYAQK
ncbi:MAG: RNA polymerase sigma factor [Puniceicoccaceae bacterium]